MKKLLALVLLLSCAEPDSIYDKVYVEIYKVEKLSAGCRYYIFAIPPQMNLNDSTVVMKCGKLIGDRLYIDRQ